jgi:hypothetical protein
MRKLIWLALGLGAAKLLERQAAKRGVSTQALVTNFAANALASFKGENRTASPPAPPKHDC